MSSDRTWKTAAHLVVEAEGAKPISSDDFVKSIGLTPDKAWAVGDLRVTGLKMRWKSSGLRITSRLPDDASPLQHIDDIRTRLQPYEAAFERFVRPFRVQLDLVVYTSGHMPIFNLPVESLQWLVSINASLDVDVIISL